MGTLFDGDNMVIDNMWAAALQCLPLINQQQYSYNAFDTFGGHNSNAVFSTVAACMGVDPGKLTLQVAPGLHDLIVPKNYLDAIYQKALDNIAKQIETHEGGGGGGGSGGGGGGSPGGIPIDPEAPDPDPSHWDNPSVVAPTAQSSAHQLHAQEVVLVGVPAADHHVIL